LFWISIVIASIDARRRERFVRACREVSRMRKGIVGLAALAQGPQLLWLPPAVQEIFDRFSACDRLRASFRPILQWLFQKPRPVW